MKDIIEKSLQNTLTYTSYREKVIELLSENKSTGHVQSDDLTNYSLLNDKRMKRLDKTIKLSDKTIAKIKELKQPQTWLVITEGWCGDAAQNLPVINKLAEINDLIDLKIVLRDDHQELMNLFLTNGGMAIPKLIALDSKNEVLNTWGPRPSTATQMVADYKKAKGSLDADFKQDLQVWYNKNKGQNVQEDFIEMVEKQQ
ncbi:thioredoxin family protein [uncultured Polaribacter sp.]|uniref:thioredoxin family protein n=1 Tax=uncultured Polaribacter sp. TaxID=174711 RepID=UPI00260FA727|nr:thioredoxin family protein [uncultured Polaribacter sp.]